MPNAQKTAIVTGASQGIGAGLVDAFLKRGYVVVANSQTFPRLIRFRPLVILRWSLETSATQKRQRRSYTLPFPASAESTC